MHQAALLSPSAQAHPHIFQKQPFHVSFAGSGESADMLESPPAAGVGKQQLGHALRSPIGRIRKPQRNRLDCLQLIHDDIDYVTLPQAAPAQRLQLAGVKDEVLQQRRHIDDATLYTKRFRCPWPQI